MFAKIATIRNDTAQKRAGQSPSAAWVLGGIMAVDWRETAQTARIVMQTGAHGLIVALALTLIGASLAAAFGLLPWLQITLFFGGTALSNTGMWLQLGLTLLLVQTEEIQAQKQLKRREADLKEILPTLGYDFDLEDRRDANVVALPKPGK